MKDFVINLLILNILEKFPKLKKCTCGRKRIKQLKIRHRCTSPKQKLEVLKFKEFAKAYRPEETPRLLFIYVRWKSRRDGLSEFNSQTRIETFTPFGEITNVVPRAPILRWIPPRSWFFIGK